MKRVGAAAPTTPRMGAAAPKPPPRRARAPAHRPPSQHERPQPERGAGPGCPARVIRDSAIFARFGTEVGGNTVSPTSTMFARVIRDEPAQCLSVIFRISQLIGTETLPL
jgi:hypothetical protein